jgi:hypothetical protein
MIRIVRSLALLAALACSAGDAAAQLEFAGIPWGTPPQATANRLHSLGYCLRGVDQEGDWVFFGPDGEEVVAVMSPTARLVGVEVRWRGDRGRISTLYTRMRDSMVAVHGMSFNERSDGAAWNRAGNVLQLWQLGPQAHPGYSLTLFHGGPGGPAEEERRNVMRAAARRREYGSSDYPAVHDAVVYDDDGWVHVMEESTDPLGNGVYRVRLYHDSNRSTVRRLENGVKYNGAIREVDLDCGRNWQRLLRTIPLYERVPAPAVSVPERARRWVQPTPGSRDERIVRATCKDIADEERHRREG